MCQFDAKRLMLGGHCAVICSLFDRRLLDELRQAHSVCLHVGSTQNLACNRVLGWECGHVQKDYLADVQLIDRHPGDGVATIPLELGLHRKAVFATAQR